MIVSGPKSKYPMSYGIKIEINTPSDYLLQLRYHAISQCIDHSSIRLFNPSSQSLQVIALLDIRKCLYDAISRMEKTSTVEGVEHQFGSNVSS
ncbi:CBS / octicosapeptide/Phox/Bemp1 domains-containing protein [Perilla frutescens var. hirtella]|uniref:CBS / octicosapeptide/Phox/Bemp1 domains-containing protein n=1 Tax=Perilla frutescens var. hirtella TaxID=608512 RepID=A0AAD4J0Q6_PERFH|nr:CBS / octicosapeptide/Phox/Bemp1 domains-containing protein [Perilla frutescens var. hirtella]